jgi:hypothetical protein
VQPDAKRGALADAASKVIGKVVGAVDSSVGALLGAAPSAQHVADDSRSNNNNGGLSAERAEEPIGPAPAPARRAFRHEDMLPPELAAAVRDFDVDNVDVQLFAIYAAEVHGDVACAGGYKRLYLANFMNLIRDLMWLRDGPESPTPVDVFRLSRFLAWRTVSEVQERFPGIERDGNAAKDYIDVATFHYAVTHPVWGVVLDSCRKWASSPDWHLGADVADLLLGRDGATSLPSPRELLSQLAAVRRYGRIHGALEAEGEGAAPEWQAPQPLRVSLAAAESAASAISAMEPFASKGVMPAREQLAELVRNTSSRLRAALHMVHPLTHTLVHQFTRVSAEPLTEC